MNKMGIRTLKLMIKIHLTTALGSVKANEALETIEDLESQIVDLKIKNGNLTDEIETQKDIVEIGKAAKLYMRSDNMNGMTYHRLLELYRERNDN